MKKRVSWQEVKEVEHASKYEDYVFRSRFNPKLQSKESPNANPDLLRETDGMFALTERQQELRGVVGESLEQAHDELSQEDYQIVVMMLQELRSERNAADMLGISQATFHRRWVKLKAYMAKVINARQD